MKKKEHRERVFSMRKEDAPLTPTQQKVDQPNRTTKNLFCETKKNLPHKKKPEPTSSETTLNPYGTKKT